MMKPLALNQIYNMPAQEMLIRLPREADLIFADPPWNIGYRSTRMGKMPVERKGVYAKVRAPRKPLEQFNDRALDTSWISAAYDALKPGGAMYLFTRWDVLYLWHQAALKAGFKVPQRIVWDKRLWGPGNLKYFGSQTEDVLFCVKGKHCLRWEKRQGNVWPIGKGNVMSQDGGGRHPTQKPTALFKQMLQLSSDVGDLVIDPFSGSGAACYAAREYGRDFIGSDISQTFVEAANIWIKSKPVQRVMKGIHV